ncbi:MAG: helix-turn-helix transcriptional regulator, partial [Nitrospinales bacterium]
MARILFRLLHDPHGISYQALKNDYEINDDRTLRTYLQDLKEIPELFDSNGETLIQVSGQGEDRRVYRKQFDLGDENILDHIVSLQFAHSMLRFLKGTELEKHLEKLCSSPYSGPNKNLLLGLDKKIYSINEWPKDYTHKTQVIRDCLHSLFYQKTLKVRYKSQNSPEIKDHELNIYTFLQYRNGLYLIAKSNRGPMTFSFAVERISSTQRTRRQFHYPPNYSPEKYLDGAFGLISGQNKSFDVEVNFDSSQEEIIKARKWHPTARITNLKDGTIKLKMTVTALEQVV